MTSQVEVSVGVTTLDYVVKTMELWDILLPYRLAGPWEKRVYLTIIAVKVKEWTLFLPQFKTLTTPVT